ncbi:GYDIA family GHMP kinase [Croceivirga thetidis]|uniref:GHMP kinase n=1 Tax=Croceivirga thetidis TaxID=2721623 RepID=A0ABX1GRM2_9FLAO|nr:GYDIA family GHMP kinase [Croceivirga thetidis]NKI31686.1 GHMP kinase [Croceivirga thetidis]
MAEKYYSNGKLLLTGEYAILDGAMGLAVPTKFGQSLEVFSHKQPKLVWKSFDEDSSIWFEADFDLDGFSILNTSDKETAETLQKILTVARIENPEFLNTPSGVQIETRLGFPRKWGLGTSSTLINNIAQWANIDAYTLLSKTLGGSGYDIACAHHYQPLLYRLDLGKSKVLPLNFHPPFDQSLFFIYLNKKQNSRKAIANYRKQTFNKKKLVDKINDITQSFLEAQRVEEMESLILEHEMALSTILGMPPIKQKFPDYFGALKSLGAWGGDFILATGNEKTPAYFKDRGFDIVIPYSEMVL